MRISLPRSTSSWEHRTSADRQERALRSELLSFLSTNEFLVRADEQAPRRALTHTLLDGSGGGKICLPDSAGEGFMAAYGADLSKGTDLFVVERRTAVFKMHFDLDLKTLHAPDTTESVVDTLQEAVAAFITTDRKNKEAWCITCAVLDAEDRTMRKAPGLHVVFPWLQVDSEMALWLRASVVRLLRSRFAELESDWETVVDIAVLTSN